ncbi:IS4 family transposase [Actinoallomurus rhizosphaericola]|uniref:IS4 family transposase n=1 Tax=Actinoallomurus rhizosphaericola TaxID=2952536 RepID=UPI002092269F|nr:IS4 family transposase [Actinoallomurus rhizosphaericola]MCO5999424.1 IS4 family transposase [Actinoallomurus rhizosphaericola]
MAGLTREKRTADDRLPDRVMVGLLAKTYPPALVDAVVKETGVGEQRTRALPAGLTVYFTLALWVWARAGYDAVLGRLLDGLAWIRADWGGKAVPTTGAIAKARARLGWRVMEALFGEVAGPVGDQRTPGAFWRDRRVCSVDGLAVDVPDTTANDQAFCRPDPRKPPQVRVIALAECATGAVIDAVVEGDRSTAQRRAVQLADSVDANTLLLAGRSFAGAEVWNSLTERGLWLVWRTDSPAGPPVEVLDDGTYLAEMWTGPTVAEAPVRVRVVEYTVEGEEGEDPESFTLITSLTDPDKAPAIELAQLYARRWRIRESISAIKDKRAGEPDLRSKSPEVVYQETWALLCVYQAIRDLIWAAVTGVGLDASRISLKPWRGDNS